MVEHYIVFTCRFLFIEGHCTLDKDKCFQGCKFLSLQLHCTLTGSRSHAAVPRVPGCAASCVALQVIASEAEAALFHSILTEQHFSPVILQGARGLHTEASMPSIVLQTAVLFIPESPFIIHP